MVSRVLAGARQVLTVALAATVLGTVVGTAIGLLIGYFGGIVDDILSRMLDAFLSIPLVITGMLALAALGPNTHRGDRRDRPGVHTRSSPRRCGPRLSSERQLDYVTAAQLRKDNTLYILFVEMLAQRDQRDHRRIHRAPRIRDLHRPGPVVSRLRGRAFDSGLGTGDRPALFAYLTGGVWWPVLFPALAIASLVVGVNLVADSVSQALE